jgi:glycosyltransferase involved in cell wall biosynthesis
MISVVVPSNRVGGLDVLFDSLARQTHKDFELVFVDNLYRYRKDVVAENAKRYDFPVKHVPPRDDPFPKVAYCQTMNTGVAHSRGDTLVYLCDYCWLDADCLETHAAIQAARPLPLLLDFSYTALPEIKPGLPEYSTDRHAGPQSTLHSESPEGYRDRINEITLRYKDDLDAGRLDEYLWSVFTERPTEESVRALPIEHTHYKGDQFPGNVWDDYNWCCFKNESFPTELMLNYEHDEAYDESHVYQDHEFSYRLRRDGIPWWAARGKGEVRCLNMHWRMTVKWLEKPTSHNKWLCEEGRPAWMRMPVNPERDLRRWRKDTLGL